MKDFIFAIHYDAYRYYKRKDFGCLTSMIVACGFHCCLLGLFVTGVGGVICKLTNVSSSLFEYLLILYFCAFWVIEYLILIRNGAYEDVFRRFEQFIETPAVKKKIKYARIFSACVVAMGVIGLSIVDYINNH